MHSVGFQVEHAVMIGRLLDQIALCQLLSQVTLPPEVQSRSRASTRSGRTKTPTTSAKERAEETGAENVGAILDEALRHMKLAQAFPGMWLYVVFLFWLTMGRIRKILILLSSVSFHVQETKNKSPV